MNKVKRGYPRIFIVILNWNGLKDTLECLSSLKKITYKNFKVVVVDNGSVNGEGITIKKKFDAVHLIKSKTNLGFTGGCNLGIRYALKNNADYVLLLNNDTIVKRDFLERLILSPTNNVKTGILSPKILYYKSTKIWSMGGKLNYITGVPKMIGKNEKSINYREVIEPDFITGCAMLIKKSLLDKIGLLDQSFFAYYEDINYCIRAKSVGYSLKTIPTSIIWHKKSASAGIKGKDKLTDLQLYLRGRNGILLAMKNLKDLDKALFMFGQLTMNLIYISINSKSILGIFQYLRGIKDGLNFKYE